ncbi:hypothetical protein LCGC14_1162660 [marine sediment metagenome]|uniref:Uncharacterized protein n=1 Tax=marine sediment metagenome TaxID=412755 RepID=A0A0F9PXR0_9ZZZZ
MQAQLWQIWISEGMLAANHGIFFPIFEVYIPEMSLAVNISGIIEADAERYQPVANEHSLDMNLIQHQPQLVKEAELPPEVDDLLKIITEAQNAEEKLGEILGNLFEEFSVEEDDDDEDSNIVLTDDINEIIDDEIKFRF